jgi:hypothetical protein
MPGCWQKWPRWKPMRTLVLALLVLTLSVPTARGQEESANFLLPGCKAFMGAGSAPFRW